MRYYANPSSPGAVKAMKEGKIGMIETHRQGQATAPLEVLRTPGTYWCADNGAFGGSFREDTWWGFLKRRAEFAPSCTFAVAPDVVGKAQETLDRSAPWFSRLRALGYPVALVAQDGLQHLEVPWDDFDCLFIGGSTAWKLSSHPRALAAEARERGKWVHMGRVNSFKRMIYAYRIGCDSADGTYLTYGPRKNLQDILMWVEVINDHERGAVATEDH